jgi:putative endonuclease
MLKLRGRMKDYFVYIVRCSDNSYYTGSTSNLQQRIDDHNSAKYDGYTSKRLPVILVYSNRFDNADDAIRAERQIKGWSRAKKEALIKGDFEELKRLSRSKNNQGHASTGSA